MKDQTEAGTINVLTLLLWGAAGAAVWVGVYLLGVWLARLALS